MVTRVTLTEEQQIELERLTGHKIDHLELKPKVVLTLTEDQREQIRQTLGRDLGTLELNEFDLKTLTAPAAYENGLTVGLGLKG